MKTHIIILILSAMKNLTIIKRKPDTILIPLKNEAHTTLLKNYQQILFTIKDIIKTNFMIL